MTARIAFVTAALLAVIPLAGCDWLSGRARARRAAELAARAEAEAREAEAERLRVEEELRRTTEALARAEAEDVAADTNRARAEIAQLSTAIDAFRSAFAVTYLPSRIRLREKGDYDLDDPLDRDSLVFLKQMFPRLAFPVNWDGRGEPDGHYTLEGDQALVFFLGGIPSSEEGKGPTGFSKNPRNPAEPGGRRDGAFFEFPVKRLAKPGKSPFPHFIDPFGKQPYAYFSAYSRNDYYRYAAKHGSDCARLGLWPYAESIDPLKCANPKSFQIISAGPDGKFGGGTDPKTGKMTWSSKNPTTGLEGKDDLSNFHRNPLGVRD